MIFLALRVATIAYIIVLLLKKSEDVFTVKIAHNLQQKSTTSFLGMLNVWRQKVNESVEAKYASHGRGSTRPVFLPILASLRLL